MGSERFTINFVVLFLGLVVLFGMGIGGWLAVDEKNVPDFIIATTAGAIGGLSALLARTSTIDQPQQVTGPEGGPVPTTETPPKRVRKK